MSIPILISDKQTLILTLNPIMVELAHRMNIDYTRIVTYAAVILCALPVIIRQRTVTYFFA